MLVGLGLAPTNAEDAVLMILVCLDEVAVLALCEGSRIKLEWTTSITLWSEGARKVLKEVGLLEMGKVGGKCKTWLLELLAGGVEEEGTGNDDEDAVSRKIVVSKTEPAPVGLG
jgi:hypothetical protein